MIEGRLIYMVGRLAGDRREQGRRCLLLGLPSLEGRDDLRRILLFSFVGHVGAQPSFGPKLYFF